ncbi:MAG: hypothetical protein ACI8TF_001638 [Paracoccaceae bacterium]|jgi:hypothetical protein
MRQTSAQKNLKICAKESRIAPLFDQEISRKKAHLFDRNRSF